MSRKSSCSWPKEVSRMLIAVLALQGAFVEHEAMLTALGAKTFEIRQKRDLSVAFDGLVIPGGESTVQGKLMRELGLFDPIREKINEGLPVFGTCAGLILLANRVCNDDRKHLATMDIEVVRNAFGRQLGSFHTEGDFTGVGRIPHDVHPSALHQESMGGCRGARAR